VDSIVALNGFENSSVSIGIGDELVVAVPQVQLSVRTQEGVVYEEEYEAEPEIIENDDWYNTQETVISQGSTGTHIVNAVITYEDGIETGREIVKETIVEEAVPTVIERGTKIPPTYIKPLNGGSYSSGFKVRWGRMHKGVDWSTPIGTTVFASSDGVVASAGYRNGYGYCVYINHPDGRQTRYAHLSEVLVSQGQSVSQGQTIAKSGNTGRSTGPHVHFEILINGVQVNPLEYLN
jgi:murein DD-endopeptidase MepM/ murein hydrolase activator NlpD